MHGLLNMRRMPARALLLLAALSIFYAAQAEEADEAVRANSDTSESLLPDDLFNSESLFGRLSDRVHFSGFARLVGGYLDVEDVHYQGYNDTISFGQHSLFALQTDVELTETLSFPSCCAQSQHPERPVERYEPEGSGLCDCAQHDEVEDPTLCGEHRVVAHQAVLAIPDGYVFAPS